MDAPQVTQDAGTASSPWAPSAEALAKATAFDHFEVALRGTGSMVRQTIRHTFTPGLYSRTSFDKAGTQLLSVIHKTEHPFLISQGKAAIYMEKGGELVCAEVVEAPHMAITKPGTQRAVKILEDCICTTFHLTEPVDFDGLEDVAEEDREELVGARIIARITEDHINPLLEHPGPVEALRFADCLKQAKAIVAERRAQAPEGCDPQNSAAITIAAIGLVVAGTGAVVSYQASQTAAATQNQFAMANANAQEQAAQQAGTLGQEQAAVNQQLAANAQKADAANAASLEQQAEDNSKISEQNIERNRVQFQRVLASQRVQAAQGGVLDTTGSPYDNLLATATREQQSADQINYNAEVQRRQTYTAAQEATNQGIQDQISGLTQDSKGAAAIGNARMQTAQAQLNLFGQQAQANAIANQGTGNLLSSSGGIINNFGTAYANTPRGKGLNSIGGIGYGGPSPMNSNS